MQRACGSSLRCSRPEQLISRDMRAHHESLVRLHNVYKEIAAPFGPFAADTLVT